MKKLNNTVFIISAFLIGAIVTAGAIWVFGGYRDNNARHSNSAFSSSKLIGLPDFQSRLVPLKVAKAHHFSLDSLYNRVLKDTVVYSGGIIRNVDVLLSLGLYQNDIYNYINNEHLRLKTMLGLASVNGKKTVKLYVHPVYVSIYGADTTYTDLYFDYRGNLWKTNGFAFKALDKRQNDSMRYPDVKSTPDRQKLKGDNGLYVIDINNPCPPCSP
ncbi:hypothetical protein LX99_04206 [Mucilaginibacter oryzae]|uniref:Uncharacterized protein n=1 Tax=Mucilaginibacter oryzae TaxID=468058 RepID=A0A316H334_9SPHI|nr:hypothetical protein [Mucilaginibacter oryzae]PWK73820.1 hypothetical protein LX99_04206 [Mucilaginibacter oryzae]